MTAHATEKKLRRAERRIVILEQMIEDRTRELFLSNQELSRANDSLSYLHRVMPGALVVLDREGLVRSVNRATTELLAFEDKELLGQPVSKFACGMEDFRDGRTPTSIERVEQTWRRADGTEVPVLVSVASFGGPNGEGEDGGSRQGGVVWVGVDLTEQKQLEITLRHAQKLEAVGQLAAGIAHEINTPLQFIGDNVEFLQEAFEALMSVLVAYEGLRDHPSSGVFSAEFEKIADLADDADLDFLKERAPRALTRAVDGLSQVGRIVSAMKAFSHPDTERAPVDLNESIENTLMVAKNEYKYVAELETSLEELPEVPCNRSDINQVLLNLVVNGAHAIADRHRDSGDKGLLRIESRVESDSVVIAVQDSGTGIPQGVQSRIFDPFFTTKEVGRGSGQGLAIARTIVVDRHGGSLTFETKAGEGTTFYVRLPLESGSRRSKVAP